MRASRTPAAICCGLALLCAGDMLLAGDKPQPAAPPPTYPPGRIWHAIAANGAETVAESRLYMFGGSGGDPITTLSDLWSYSGAGTTEARWTLVQPAGATRLSNRSAPGRRQHLAWSCGMGRCVAANGSTGGGLSSETWVFDEALSSWSQVNCRRFTCPSPRMLATAAFDPARGVHVLFGGQASNTWLADTFVFDATAMRWSAMGSVNAPPARRSAAAAFVPPLDRVVMHGGQVNGTSVFHDTYSWDGAGWQAVTQQAADGSAVPALHGHSMAWDDSNARLIVTGGFVDTNDTANTETWYVTFSETEDGWVATWAHATGIACQAAAGSQDGTIHPSARMALDAAAGVQVFFGGGENSSTGVQFFDNTVECQ